MINLHKFSNNYNKFIFVIFSLLISACAKNTPPEKKILYVTQDAGMKPQKASALERFGFKMELAKRYLSLRQFELALKPLDEILQEDDSNIEALHLKAISLMSLQKYTEADTYFRKSIEKQKNPDILNNYGWFLCKQKNIKGLDYLNQAEPMANALLYPKVLANKGTCYVYQKNYTKAIEFLQQSLSINPNYIPAIVYTAFIYAKQNNTLAAESLLNKIGVNNITEPELLWLGINVFKISGNTISVKLWGNYLVAEFPDSQEVMKYHRNLIED